MAELNLTERRKNVQAEYTEGVYKFTGSVSLIDETNKICNGFFDVNKTVDSNSKYIGRLQISCVNNVPKININDMTMEDLLIVTPLANEMINAIEEEYDMGNLKI